MDRRSGLVQGEASHNAVPEPGSASAFRSDRRLLVGVDPDTSQGSGERNHR